ncbi:hypothetical protein VTJ49DRAFT_2393 [Mycothermus thermophilus]|uniref:Uncharacterized protein n=1 Tax=Humicola insolens TaxID=85995 RepID=A0ABR3VMY8_HUMIN
MDHVAEQARWGAAMESQFVVNTVLPFSIAHHLASAFLGHPRPHDLERLCHPPNGKAARRSEISIGWSKREREMSRETVVREVDDDARYPDPKRPPRLARDDFWRIHPLSADVFLATQMGV